MGLFGLVNQNYAWVLCNAASDLIYGSAGIGKSTLCMGVVQGVASDLIYGSGIGKTIVSMGVAASDFI